MSSQTDICNLALTLIGARRISSIDDNTTEANDCKAVYDMTVEETISMQHWPSCRFRATLAQSLTTPEFGYAYAYTLPTNPKFLKLIELNQCKPGEVDYIVESGLILSNDSTMQIKYIGIQENTEAYDIWLRQSVVDFLVSKLIYKKTGQPTVYAAALKYAKEHSNELAGQFGTQDRATYINSDSFIDVRRGLWPDSTNW